MTGDRKNYTREFKIEAVKLVTEEGYSSAQVARDLGITSGMLARWRQKLGEDSTNAFPGKGNLKEPEAEIRRLEREVDRLRMERDILKKTIGIFSKGPK